MEQDRVKALNSDRNALENKAGLSPEIEAILRPSSEKKAYCSNINNSSKNNCREVYVCL